MTERDLLEWLWAAWTVGVLLLSALVGVVLGVPLGRRLLAAWRRWRRPRAYGVGSFYLGRAANRVPPSNVVELRGRR